MSWQRPVPPGQGPSQPSGGLGRLENRSCAPSMELGLHVTS